MTGMATVPSARTVARRATALVGLLLLAGCSGPAEPAAVETYTLQTASYSYAGHLAPEQVRKLDIAAADSRYADGQHVEKGAGLARQTSGLRDRLRAKRRALARFEERRATASRALRVLSRGSVAVGFVVAATAPSSELRDVELQIEATLIGHRRALAQYGSDLRKLLAQKPIGKVAKTDRALDVRQLQTDHHWAVAETVNQLRGLFGTLRRTADRLAGTTRRALAGLRADAPWDGTVSIEGGTVSLQSTAYTFVYTATEEQVDLLSGQDAPELHVRSTRVAALRLASVNYSPTETTNPQSPRYQLTYEVVDPVSGFVPRDHGSASLTYAGTGLVVPEAYLGRDGDDYFVLSDGVRVPVRVEKDDTGQFVLTDGGLHAGDVIQKVGQ